MIEPTTVVGLGFAFIETAIAFFICVAAITMYKHVRSCNRIEENKKK